MRIATVLLILSMGMSVPAAVAQEDDIYSAPTFAALQDHFTLDSGEEIYQYWCWDCHGEGTGKPGTAALKALHEVQFPLCCTSARI